jgi:DNA-binding NarL/FixJ family response regulator
VLSGEHTGRSCRAAAACGASAHLSLGDSPDELSAAVRGRPLTQPARCVPLDGEATPPPLSNRERDVLIHLARGFSAKQTAAMLGICPKTVDNHAQRLMRKLDLHSRADVVRFAVREGFVTA